MKNTANMFIYPSRGTFSPQNIFPSLISHQALQSQITYSFNAYFSIRTLFVVGLQHIQTNLYRAPFITTTISNQKFTHSIAENLQYISYTHSRDFIKAMARDYEHEKSQAVKDAMTQILINLRMAAMGQRPICQDTGIVTVFLQIGMECRFDTKQTIQKIVDEVVDKAIVLAKESLMELINIQKLTKKGPENKIEKVQLEIYEKVNDLGIGAQGLGGLTTALDVKILDCPTHAASLPVAMIPNCTTN